MDDAPAVSGLDRDLADEELIALVRSGDQDAFALLYLRHMDAMLRFARRCSRRHAEDLCAEAFASTLRAIKSGHGPRGPLRPYLAAAIRHAALAWSRQDLAMLLVGERADLPDAANEQDPVLSELERAIVAQAFNSLPERWRAILQHTVIDACPPTSAAAVFRIAPAAASSLAYRAREGLREAYLQAHITHVTSPACLQFTIRIAAFVRGRLGPRHDAAQRAHLAVCGDCARVLETVREIDGRLVRRPKQTPAR